MGTLYLLRHAKSDWTDPDLPDHDRPLAARGRKASRRLAAFVQDGGIRPALVLCSSATRARETLAPLLPVIGADVRVEDELYAASATMLLARLRRVPADVASVLLVGHNPGLHDLALLLTGRGDEAALEVLNANLPTGALVTLDLGDRGWAQLSRGDARLIALVTPRSLRDP